MSSGSRKLTSEWARRWWEPAERAKREEVPAPTVGGGVDGGGRGNWDAALALGLELGLEDGSCICVTRNS